MKRYIYETEILPHSLLDRFVKEDYLKVIQERGALGWRFVSFVPSNFRPKGVKGTELVFEKEVDS